VRYLAIVAAVILVGCSTSATPTPQLVYVFVTPAPTPTPTASPTPAPTAKLTASPTPKPLQQVKKYVTVRTDCNADIGTASCYFNGSSWLIRAMCPTGYKISTGRYSGGVDPSGIEYNGPIYGSKEGWLLRYSLNFEELDMPVVRATCFR
jgi:hypothetical protein